MKDDELTPHDDHIELTWREYLEDLEPLLPQPSFAIFCILTAQATPRYYYTDGLPKERVVEILRILANIIDRGTDKAITS